jgi:hypothetical protein
VYAMIRELWAIGCENKGRDAARTYTGGTFCKSNLNVLLNCVNRPSQSQVPNPNSPFSFPVLLCTAVPWELGLEKVTRSCTTRAYPSLPRKVVPRQ